MDNVPKVELKPCPFCGEPPEIASYDGNSEFIRCGNLDCMVDCHTNSNTGTIEKQAREWNKRVNRGD